MKKVLASLAVLAMFGFGGYAVGKLVQPAEQSLGVDLSLIQEQTVVVHVGEGHGSGVIFSPDTIITAKHVVQNASEIEIEFKDGVKRTAKVNWADQNADVAVLKLDVPYQHVKGASLRCETPKVGEELVAVGAPMDGRWVLSWLKASSDRPWIEDTHYVATGPLAPGMSGGPLFDRDGMVVGFSKAMFTLRIGWEGFPSDFVAITSTKEVCRQLAPEVKVVSGT